MLYNEIINAITSKNVEDLNNLLRSHSIDDVVAAFAENKRLGRYPIHFAVLSNDPTILKIIIQHDFGWAKRRNRQNQDPLTQALENPHIQPNIISIILDRNVDWSLSYLEMLNKLPKTKNFHQIRIKLNQLHAQQINFEVMDAPSSAESLTAPSSDSLLGDLSAHVSSLSFHDSESLSESPRFSISTTQTFKHDSAKAKKNKAKPVRLGSFIKTNSSDSNDADVISNPLFGSNLFTASSENLTAKMSDSDETIKNSLSISSLESSILSGIQHPDDFDSNQNPTWWSTLIDGNESTFALCMELGASLNKPNQAGQTFSEHYQINLLATQKANCQTIIANLLSDARLKCVKLFEQYSERSIIAEATNCAILELGCKIPHKATDDITDQNVLARELKHAFLGVPLETGDGYIPGFVEINTLVYGFLYHHTFADILTMLNIIWCDLSMWQKIHAVYFLKGVVDLKISQHDYSVDEYIQTLDQLQALCDQQPPGLTTLINRVVLILSQDEVSELITHMGQFNALLALYGSILPKANFYDRLDKTYRKEQSLEPFFAQLLDALKQRSMHNFTKLAHLHKAHKGILPQIKMQDAGLTNMILCHLLSQPNTEQRIALWSAYLSLCEHFTFKAIIKDFNSGFGILAALNDSHVIMLLGEDFKLPETLVKLNKLYSPDKSYKALRQHECEHAWPCLAVVSKDLVMSAETEQNLDNLTMVGKIYSDLNKAISLANYHRTPLKSNICTVLDEYAKLERDFFYQLANVAKNKTPELCDDLNVGPFGRYLPAGELIVQDENKQVFMHHQAMLAVLEHLKKQAHAKHHACTQDILLDYLNKLARDDNMPAQSKVLIGQLRLDSTYKALIHQVGGLETEKQQTIVKAFQLNLRILLKRPTTMLENILKKLKDIIANNTSERLSSEVRDTFFEFTQNVNARNAHLQEKIFYNPLAYLPLKACLSQRQIEKLDTSKAEFCAKSQLINQRVKACP